MTLGKKSSGKRSSVASIFRVCFWWNRYAARAAHIQYLGDRQPLQIHPEWMAADRSHVSFAKRAQHGKRADDRHLLPQLDPDVVNHLDRHERAVERLTDAVDRTRFGVEYDALVRGLPLDHAGLDPKRGHIGDAIGQGIPGDTAGLHAIDRSDPIEERDDVCPSCRQMGQLIGDLVE